MSPDTLVGTAGSLLGASGDSAANQLQADLQAVIACARVTRGSCIVVVVFPGS